MNAPRSDTTVLKFGGAALADGPRIETAGRVLLERGGERPIAVVSAFAGVTTALERMAAGECELEDTLRRIRLRHRSVLAQLRLDSELCDRLLAELATVARALRTESSGEAELIDCALSFGERMSARIVAAHLRERGVDATPVDAYDLGLWSDSNHGRARPLPGSEVRVCAALEAIPALPVVTGFVAADERGNLTTLGRNGSDLTAALIAAAVGAREVCFWKTVGGVRTADPVLVRDARPIPRLTYDEAADYAEAGARVIHPDTLAPLAAAGIPARVLDVGDPDGPSTLIAGGAPSAAALGVATRTEPARATVVGALAADVARGWLAAASVPVLDEDERGAGRCPYFVVDEHELPRAARALHAGLLACEVPSKQLS
jgi:aspartate kinase